MINRNDPVVTFEILENVFSIDPETKILKNPNELNNDFSPLFFCLYEKDLFLHEEQWDYLIKNSNLNFYMEINGNYISIFHLAMITPNKSFNMKPEYLDLLVKNSDLKLIDDLGDNLLLSAITNIFCGNLQLSAKQFEYMVRNSNLTHLNNYGYSALSLMLFYFQPENSDENNFLTQYDDNFWQYLFDNSDLDIIVNIGTIHYDIQSLIDRVVREDWRNYFSSVYNRSKNKSIPQSIPNENSTIDDYKERIKSIVGLNDVKESFNTLINLYQFNKSNNLPLKTHMKIIFVGNHGTGKSVISEHIARLYNAMGLLKNNISHTVFNGFFFLEEKDLKAFDQNSVYCKFDAKIKYEANTELLMIEKMKKLGDSSLFILSVTPEDLEEVKLKYPKFYSLFTKTINFPDYSAEELVEISNSLSKNQGFTISDEGINKLKLFYNNLKKNKYSVFPNAYLAQSTLNKIIELHINRNNSNLIISAEDIPDFETVEDKSIEDLLKDLNDMTGLEGVKNTLINFIALVKANKLRGTTLKTNMHLVFTGNPGTGKTTVARLIGEIYKSLGLLPKGHVVETDRSQLVGQYIGHTAVQTRNLIQKAMGGILFIDEAYTLNKVGTQNDFGKECIEILLKSMEDNREDFAVIVAGYPEEMKSFIEANPGLKSRFTKTVFFEDYSTKELIEILEKICIREKFKYDQEFLSHAEKYINEIKGKNSKGSIGFTNPNTVSNNKSFGNAREIRTLFEKVLEKQAVRIMKNSSADPWLLTKDDIEILGN